MAMPDAIYPEINQGSVQMIELAPIIDRAKTPEAWVQVLTDRGLAISARKLRELANRLGECFKVSRVMLITPEQLNNIIESQKKCPSNHTSAARSGGRAVGSNTPARRSVTTTDAALAHLKNLALGNGAGRKNRRSSAPTC